MDAKVRGLNQAIRNANDGISLAQTAEGAMGEISNILVRMRELSVQAANGTTATSDRAAIQTEVTALLGQIDDIAGRTDFNGTKRHPGGATRRGVILCPKPANRLLTLPTRMPIGRVLSGALRRR